MLNRLLTTSFVFAAVGLASGLFFRAWSKAFHFDGQTQLALAHTHFLALGFIVTFLAFLAEKAFRFSAAAPRVSSWFVWTWVLGVAVTGGMMVLKGALEVTGADVSSPGFAGIAGLGHVLLTAAFVLFFLALRRSMVASGVSTHDAGGSPSASLPGGGAPSRSAS
ncbi:DUF2871 domain-containing protein [Sinomonas sp. ASV486]|uniref:DUF2871 domain-containing protein n=1 Tax=Sinomonas sp. ASV486 TaxID=3051170 RepID=UPI0027DE1D59|nr:DUF2871 domain-containing protein [Sinomonas sp. ASV486]MDQ4490214.1 DUF2871 domain-containing protein [Sinomonas sp. ASV486]